MIATSDNCADPELCRAAATRAYRELLGKGLPDPEAFEAAVRLYLYRHPATALREARLIVADWISEELGE